MAITVEANPGVVLQRLEEMTGGWFVGNFRPAAFRTRAAEVALKHIPAGTVEPLHDQMVATEVTLVVSGTVRLCGRVLVAGDILSIPPRTPAAFEALSDAVVVVVKTPSEPDDKRSLDLPL